MTAIFKHGSVWQWEILQTLRRKLCSSYIRVVLSDYQEPRAAQLEIQLHWRQHCENKKTISVLWMSHLLLLLNTRWHHLSLMRPLCSPSDSHTDLWSVRWPVLGPVWCCIPSIPCIQGTVWPSILSAPYFPLWVWCPLPAVILFSSFAALRGANRTH